MGEERFGAEARQIMSHAEALAVEWSHPEIATHHLLIALLDNDGMAELLRGLGADPKSVKSRIKELHPEGETRGIAYRPYSRLMRRAIDIALRSMLTEGARTIAPEHLYLGVVVADDEAAELALQVEGSLDDARAALAEQLPGVASMTDLKAPRCPTCDERLDETLRSRLLIAPADDGGPDATVQLVFCEGCRQLLTSAVLQT